MIHVCGVILTLTELWVMGLFIWFVFVCSCRQQLSTVERSRQKFKAAPLTVEFVPFFYRKSISLDEPCGMCGLFIYWSNLLFYHLAFSDGTLPALSKQSSLSVPVLITSHC